MLAKLFTFGQDNDFTGLNRHVPYRLSPHLILVGESGCLGKAIRSNKEMIHKKVPGVVPNGRSHQHLLLLLINASQQNDLAD